MAAPGKCGLHPYPDHPFCQLLADEGAAEHQDVTVVVFAGKARCATEWPATPAL
jgi:hypothetical protein